MLPLINRASVANSCYVQYSDAARLLSFYQLWLDDLFPKAKFLDAAAMVEKLGHKKRMHMMRMGWINEGKPKDPVQEESIFDEPMLPPREVSDRNNAPPRIAPIFEKTQIERPKTPDINGDSDEDLYDATPRIPRTQVNEPAIPTEGGSLFGPRKTTVPEEPEDDLDALLAEQEMEEMNAGKRPGATSQDHSMAAPEPDFDDEMEAMAEMGDMYDC
jgi:replication fork protection complex subunit Csm3/Swi3